MRSLATALAGLLFAASASASGASPASWIWYPGDFEIWLSNQVQVRRVERDAPFMPFWRFYSHQPQVNFSKQFELAAPEEITVTAEGKYSIQVDGKFVQGDQKHVRLTAGKHSINVQVYNQVSPPAILVEGKTISSNTTWTVGPAPYYKPSNGPAIQAAGRTGGPPSQFRLATREIQSRGVQRKPESILVDFGEETIGFVKLKNLRGRGKVTLYYGESLEEALATDTCETLDRFTVDSKTDFTSTNARAMR